MKTNKQKRIKTVFKNSECAHVWASQTQEHGRNANGSLYFNGTSIYSYGRHYHLGEILTVKGQRVVMINTKGYSSTTTQHIWDVKSATSHMISIDCDAGNLEPRQALEDTHALLGERYYDAFKRLDFYSSSWYMGKDAPFNDFKKDVNEFNSHCDLFGFLDLKIDLTSEHESLWAEKQLESRERLARLNTPEALEKKRIEKEKREAKAEALKNMKIEEARQVWINGGVLRQDLENKTTGHP